MNSLTRGGVLLLGALAGIGLGAGEAHAQVGLKAGLSHGSISNTGVLPGDLGGRTGFAAGLSFGTGYETPLGIGIELLYAQRGSEEPNNPSSRELDYIDIPAYVRLAIPAESVQPFAYLGPQVSFEVDCSTVDDDCPDTGRPTTTYAGVVGAGVRLGTELGITIEARYIYGLTDLDIETITDEDSYEDRSFVILAGISF